MHLWQEYHRIDVFSGHPTRGHAILTGLLNQIHFELLNKGVSARLLHRSYSFSLFKLISILWRDILRLYKYLYSLIKIRNTALLIYMCIDP
jgi:hypothetical protein